MDRDYAQPLDVPALERGASMSLGHFSRTFRTAFGESPYAYLMKGRIESPSAYRARSHDDSVAIRA